MILLGSSKCSQWMLNLLDRNLCQNKQGNIIIVFLLRFIKNKYHVILGQLIIYMFLQLFIKASFFYYNKAALSALGRYQQEPTSQIHLHLRSLLLSAVLIVLLEGAYMHIWGLFLLKLLLIISYLHYIQSVGTVQISQLGMV